MEKKTRKVLKEARAKLRGKTLKDFQREADADKDRFTSVKIGDPIPPDDTVLGLLKIRSVQFVDKTVAETLTHGLHIEALANRVRNEFQMTLAGEMVEIPVLGTYKVPKSWWQMFKLEVLGMHEDGIEWEIKEVVKKVSADMVYPYLRLPQVLPDSRACLVSVRVNEMGQPEYRTKVG